MFHVKHFKPHDFADLYFNEVFFFGKLDFRQNVSTKLEGSVSRETFLRSYRVCYTLLLTSKGDIGGISEQLQA